MKMKGNMTQKTEEKSKGSFKDRRKECIEKLDKEVKKIDFKGKEYLTVAARHNHLLKFFPESKIDEQLIYQDDKKVITKTTLYIGDAPYSTGHAEEKRDASFVNRTSALENAFTSSLGRCLASFGLHGTEFASAEELANALKDFDPRANNSIEKQIESQKTETKLNALYSKWETENERIKKVFDTKANTIKNNGGQNVKSSW